MSDEKCWHSVDALRRSGAALESRSLNRLNPSAQRPHEPRVEKARIVLFSLHNARLFGTSVSMRMLGGSATAHSAGFIR
jgi:hypothetical protein